MYVRITCSFLVELINLTNAKVFITYQFSRSGNLRLKSILHSHYFNVCSTVTAKSTDDNIMILMIQLL